MKDFRQIAWDDALKDDCRELIRLAVREDLERGHDWTTLALAPADSAGLLPPTNHRRAPGSALPVP